MHSNLEGSALALAADRKNRLPLGCSYQGRHPEAEPGYDDTVPMAAEAATSIGAESPRIPRSRRATSPMVMFLVIFAVSLVALMGSVLARWL